MTRLRNAIERLREEEVERVKGRVALMSKTAKGLVTEVSTFFEECLDDKPGNMVPGPSKPWTFSCILNNDSMTIAINFPNYLQKIDEHYSDNDLDVLMGVVHHVFQAKYPEYAVGRVGHSLVIREQPPVKSISWRGILRMFCPIRREE